MSNSLIIDNYLTGICITSAGAGGMVELEFDINKYNSGIIERTPGGRIRTTGLTLSGDKRMDVLSQM